MTTHYLYTENDFDIMGMEIAKYRKSTSFRIQRDNFVSFYGVEPYMVAIIWKHLVEKIESIRSLAKPNPKHLLWGLLFYQCYDTNRRNAALCGCDIKTYRKWAWLYMEAMADLDVHVVSTTSESVAFCVSILFCFLTCRCFEDSLGEQIRRTERRQMPRDNRRDHVQGPQLDKA